MYVTAQQLYSLRERTGFCSGADLSRFFEATVGDPSPKGYTPIDRQAAQDFVAACVAEMMAHSPSAFERVAKEAPNLAIAFPGRRR